MAEVDDLFKKYSNDSPAVSTAPETSSIVDDLYNKFTTQEKYTGHSIDPNQTRFAPSSSFVPPAAKRFGTAIGQGFKDVATTFGELSSPASRIPGLSSDSIIEKQFQNELEKAKQENIKFGEKNQDLSSSAGRIVGQVAATVPLLPVEGINAINAGLRAVPTMTAAGTKIAPRLTNRLLAASATGGAGGAVFGAATSGANDAGFLKNTAEGLITGALAGPVIAGASGGVNALINKGVNTWNNIRVDRIVNKTGLPANAVRNIIDRLDAAGLTPLSAQAELNRLGPKATLADLDASLTAEARGLATMGDKPTSILKNRFAARASQGADEVNNIIDQHLGPHVNLEAEKENIVKAAQKAVDKDYKTAHTSNQVLDVQPVIDDINHALETAVGSKQSRLAEVKGYLYRDFKKPDGTTETIPRFGIKDLHETRIGIDGLLNKMKQEGDSQTSATYRAVENVRNEVDALLKQNPEMKVADEKFATEMKKKDALQLGYDVLKKNYTTSRFGREILTNPNQEEIKKGMRSFIGDYLETGTQGEENAAQRLFSKKASNRANLENTFGPQAKGALDELEKREAFKATERAIQYGSDTAQNLSVQSRYKPQQSGPSNVGEALAGAAKGAITDIAFGGGAPIATATMAVRGARRNALIHLSEDRTKQLAEGTADIISRSGQSVQNALNIAERVDKVQQRIAKVQPQLQLPTLKLPALFGGAVGDKGYENYGQKYLDYLK